MENSKPGLFAKILAAGEMQLDQYLAKARSEIAQEEDDAFWRKSVYRDLNYQVSSQGYTDRGTKIGFAHLKQMSMKDTIVAAIIQTRQNQVSAFSRAVKESSEMGFRIVRKNEERALEEIKEELFGKDETTEEKAKAAKGAPDAQDTSAKTEAAIKEKVAKARSKDLPFNDPANELDEFDGEEGSPMQEPGETEAQVGDLPEEDQPEELSDRAKLRLAKEELRKRDREKVEALAEFIQNCGLMEDRPFEAMRWDFDSWLRATVRDALTYDQHATEVVRDQQEKPHHFIPVDGSTIRLTTPEFSQYRNQDLSSGYDILYPEKELEALKEDDAITLDQEKVEEGDYKYCQVIKGRIERAFTPEELCVGMRNPTADIYANGYSVSELELLVGAVSSHIFTENYNHSYYTQGFSAKGILHIKAPVNRRKLEMIRMQWKAMVSGAKNSFQTPILAGMDEVQWIPLTQNHSDMEFSNWMNYLIKIICGIYQIDPTEIGFGMKEEGGNGGGLGGDATKEKLENSKDKGLHPLLRHIENFINKNVMSSLDDDFKFQFCGLQDEDSNACVERQSKEVKFMKSVNDIREEQGLPPIEGADDLILDPTYFQWFSQFHPEGKKLNEQNSILQAATQPPMEAGDDEDGEGGGDSNFPPAQGPSPFGKSIAGMRRKARKKKAPVVIEYYGYSEE
jgi:Phage portal protein.